MNEINTKIDNYVKNKRRKSIFAIALTLIITVPILLWLMTPPLGSVTQITGVVVRLTGIPTDEGEKLYLLVKLKDSNTVRSYIENSSLYKKGGTVKLDIMEPLLFGRTVYRYRGYVN